SYHCYPCYWNLRLRNSKKANAEQGQRPDYQLERWNLRCYRYHSHSLFEKQELVLDKVRECAVEDAFDCRFSQHLENREMKKWQKSEMRNKLHSLLNPV